MFVVLICRRRTHSWTTTCPASLLCRSIWGKAMAKCSSTLVSTHRKVHVHMDTCISTSLKCIIREMLTAYNLRKKTDVILFIRTNLIILLACYIIVALLSFNFLWAACTLFFLQSVDILSQQKEMVFDSAIMLMCPTIKSQYGLQKFLSDVFFKVTCCLRWKRRWARLNARCLIWA